MTAIERCSREVGRRLVVDTALRRAAAEFLNAADHAGIRAAPIKGIVVSTALYDDPLDRPFGDVDVLVANDDLRRVGRLAQRRGWRVVFDSKALGSVNVVVPPGLPIDVRSTVGPPGFCRIDGATALARARITRGDCGVDAQYLRLDDHDQLLILVVDAVMDKLHVRRAIRQQDLLRAVGRWVRSPASFARDAVDAELSVAARFVFNWLLHFSDEPAVARVAIALPPFPRHIAAVSGLLESAMTEHPFGLAARLGCRLLTDRPLRTAISLALGAMGTATFVARHRGRDPWSGGLWSGATPADATPAPPGRTRAE